MIYCALNDVKDDVAIKNTLIQARWTDDDIIKRIEEGEVYLESALFKIGFTREQLITAPLLKRLNIYYAFYAILRDIYVLNSPSVATPEPYTKWKEIVDNFIDNLKQGTIVLNDEDGVVILPVSDDRFYVKLNTDATSRIFSLDEPENYDVSMSNYSEEVVGKKYDSDND